MKIRNPKELEKLRNKISAGKDPLKPCVSICSSTGCLALGSAKLVEALKAELNQRGMENKVDIKETGCHGFCEGGPLLVIHPEETCYLKVSAKDIPDIVAKTLVKNEVIDRLLYTDPVTGKKIAKQSEIPFFKKQEKNIIGNNPVIDPCSIEDYLSIGGYSALSKVLFEMTPEQIIEEIKISGLRGRGGGGFPTGRKWESTRKAVGEPKYVICNADEGDPGAFMDESVLEGNPHSVLEGMLIGAFAIGSNLGYIYIRDEYPLAVKRITIAIEKAREFGLLGKNILGSGFSFDLIISRGGGAFVCGESSALFASIEGRAGEPRAKYVHATDKGLFDKPTNLNNVETWANVPLIINRGAEWYSSIGTENSKGTKIFSLVGKINYTGLVEVPMGIPLREIIFDIGGGIAKGRKFKAVQTGGPSGGCLPEEFMDKPVDFDELVKLGSMMGSGGMIIMDDQTCMVDVARYFLTFLEEESCGKCTPCREGILQMREILDRITQGLGQEEDIQTLEQMGQAIIDGSLCALGGSAPNPVLSTIRYFRDEYEAHIRGKKCPAGSCKDLISYSINQETCTGCGACLKACGTNAITGEKKKPHTIDPEKCIKCGACLETCKFNAVEVS
ncbi:MAG TPA: NADH-quinone oxidoreductase subunit F [Desulfotomaculum sp.]|nr:MAG: [Fe] hydrogenase, HymB subunit [Desulfotomaculum sp. 46_80]HAG10894.1 NADH-quinone oxidoreductase subunit F [Desulfotomaculum sp.]HBY04823.1 NADH-quinone oxidoreductase subunit F [Desulfotomaculum sp.]